jgi:hypothetical protein
MSFENPQNLFANAYAGIDALVALMEQYNSPIKTSTNVPDWAQNFRTLDIRTSLPVMVDNYINSRITADDIVVRPLAHVGMVGTMDQRITAQELINPMGFNFLRGRRYKRIYVAWPEEVFQIIDKLSFYRKLAQSQENSFIMLSG